jgi:hypothetical protein
VKRQSLFFLVVALPYLAVKLTAGCGGQGEGQLCSTLNNGTNASTTNISNDCASGLTCTPFNGYAACCPPSNSTNPACQGSNLATNGLGGSGGFGGGGTGGTSSDDGGGADGSDGGTSSDDGGGADGSDGGTSSDDGGDAGDGG